MNAQTDTPPPVTMLRMLTGYWISKALSVAAELGVADQLKDGRRSASDLAATCGADPASLYRLLRALAGVGVFTEGDDGRFGLTPLAELLRTDTPGSMRALARMYGSEQFEAWAGLEGSIRTGDPSFERIFGATYFDHLESHPRSSAVFNDAMTGWTAQLADAVVGAYDFSRSRQVVDVGGGLGLLLSTILRANQATEGVLFELPHVAADATAFLDKAGVGDRSSAVGGDFFESVPEGGTTYVVAQILHDWDDEHSGRILRNCRRAIHPDGRLLVVEQVIPPADENSLGKWLDLHMLVLLGGRERTESEYQALLATAGFELNRVIPTAAGASVLEAAPA
ncbi:methyltransferase [Nocardioides albidus]|uniref:Methyltransferase n=1 Tax=Nocardioides albidus TaxID=1517589 RepID=A0A5C4VR99_9ACTN|nr:methyltransferase [Nocardioides albidus]TNM37739.1 methyltransferase [Nocardioides albidus]